MKSLRRFCAIVALTLVLALPALAGQMEFPVVPPPPPSQAAIASPGQTAISVEETGASQESDGAMIDPLTEIALSFMQSVLSLF